MSDNAHRAAELKLAETEQRIAAVYLQAQKEVQKSANEFFDNFARLDAEKQKLVDKGEWTEKEYEDWRTNKILYSQRFKEQQAQIAQNLLHANEIAAAYVNGELPEVFCLGFNQFAQDIENIGGMSFTLVDGDTVRMLITDDKSLLPYKKLDSDKDVAWNMKKVNSEVLQGILVGESIPKLAKRMQNVTDSNMAAAIRTARTCITGAENRGRLESYNRAAKNGTILDKEWLSSDQPGRTRDWHFSSAFGSLTVPIDHPFSNSLGLIMYPGDPGAHPANVYNCRCSMCSKIKGFRKFGGGLPDPPQEQRKQPVLSYRLAEKPEDLDNEDYFTEWDTQELSEDAAEKIKSCKACKNFIEKGGLCKLKGKTTGKCLYFDRKR